MEVDQAGQRDQALGVDEGRPLEVQVGADLRDDAVPQQQVDRVATEQPGATQEVVGHAVPSFVSWAPPRRR